jgi:hypothetical protein
MYIVLLMVSISEKPLHSRRSWQGIDVGLILVVVRVSLAEMICALNRRIHPAVDIVVLTTSSGLTVTAVAPLGTKLVREVGIVDAVVDRVWTSDLELVPQNRISPDVLVNDHGQPVGAGRAWIVALFETVEQLTDLSGGVEGAPLGLGVHHVEIGAVHGLAGPSGPIWSRLKELF